jgi:hypothetical protein
MRQSPAHISHVVPDEPSALHVPMSIWSPSAVHLVGHAPQVSHWSSNSSAPIGTLLQVEDLVLTHASLLVLPGGAQLPST